MTISRPLRRVSACGAHASLFASSRRTRTAKRSQAQERLALELHRLWGLLAVAQPAQGQPDPSVRVVAASGRSRIFSRRGEEPLSAAARSALAAYGSWARQSWARRIKERALEQWAAHDGDARPDRVCTIRVLWRDRDGELILWGLPPADRDTASAGSHPLGQIELLLVLAGEPTLATPAGHWQLHPGEAAALLSGDAGDCRLLNESDQRVRLLSLRRDADRGWRA
jgi:hypothetical protein